MPSPSPLHEVLTEAGAILADHEGWSVSEHFGDPDREYQAACNNSVVFDRSALGLVELAGAEAVQFLHNLCTNDIKILSPGSGCEAYLTTTKARLIAPLCVSRLQRDGGKVLLLDTAVGLGETMVQHLKKYRISEDVEITERTGTLAHLHLCGPQAPALAAGIMGSPATTLTQMHHLEDAGEAGQFLLLRRHDVLNLPGFDLIATPERARALWTKLTKAGADGAGARAFEVLRIEAGLPIFGRELDSERLVMETGRTRQAISFTKGCYLGQETIVMARDRGHVNRQLVGLRLADKEPAQAGAKVWAGADELGQVTSSAYSPRLGNAIALAYLKRGAQTPGTAVDIDADGGRRPVVVSEVPFIPS